ncbi:MAG: hypothetical protein AAB263_02555 [Planctomycetota bacterium]
MEIASSGLANTAAAILRGQVRFDAKAQQVVDSAEAASEPSSTATASSPELVTSMVGMKQESLINSMLYTTFKQQQDQQKSLNDMIKLK